MSLEIFNNSPFNAGTQVDKDDSYLSDGVTTTYTLKNKTASRLGATIQANGIYFYQYTSGFTKNTTNNTFTLVTPAPIGYSIVAPGVSTVTATAFDQAVVDGVTNPEVTTVPFFVVDATEIVNFTYSALAGLPGIEISMVDLATSAGAQTSWVQLACSDPVTGNALAFLATGVALYIPPITAFDTLLASSASSTTSLFCQLASTFTVGNYIEINFGGLTQEFAHLTAVSGTTMTISSLNFNHYIGETVYDVGPKLWCQVTIPNNVTGGVPTNLYDLGIRRRCIKTSRI